MNKDKRTHASAKQMGWDDESGQTKRRNAILEACRGNVLKAAKILQNTAIRGRDENVRRKARNDSKYFYNMNERRKERQKRNGKK